MPISTHNISGSRFTDAKRAGTPSNRQKVLGHITAHPGIHLRKVCRDLGLGVGDVQYHLHQLEKDGAVKSSRRGIYRQFYACGFFGEKEGIILSALALRTPRELLLHLIEEPGINQEKLASVLGLSPPSVSWNLKRLIQLGLVEKTQSGRSASYRVKGNLTEITAFVRSYHPGVWERWSSRLAELVSSIAVEGQDLDP
ncbi:MAG: winged helix-turn-helix transcriptional regulator [Nitrososphaerota archaeon]|nr:winged helix-turn-helix transcriptional regulator [Nitrososphaerota archaeon]